MQVAITCPSCSSTGNIEVPTAIIENNSRGLVSINVPSKYICEHNFQFFLDKKGSIRGYQRIDFQVKTNQEQLRVEPEKKYTEFHCKLCNKEMLFNVSDKQTYLTKRDHNKYFGIQLATYQVAHVFGGEMHVNTVIVDERGSFKGHVEAYPVPLSGFLTSGEVPAFERILRVVPEENIPLRSHKLVETLFLLDRETQQVLALICPESLKILEIAKISLEKVKEHEKLFEHLDKTPILNIAGQIFHFWASGNRILVASLTSEEGLPAFDVVAKKLLESTFEDLVNRVERLEVALLFLEKSRLLGKDLQAFFRFVTDDRLFSKIQVKYSENIPHILARLKEEFGFDLVVLAPFLRGYKSMSEVLDVDTLPRASELFEVVDYIERRKLLE